MLPLDLVKLTALMELTRGGALRECAPNIKLKERELEHVFAQKPLPQSVRLIDFDRAEVHPGFLPRTYILVVSGTKPYLNLQVNLSPLVYVRQPEYWGIEVIGSLPGIGLPALAPYTVSIPIDGVLGSIGIEVIGANKAEKIDIMGPGDGKAKFSPESLQTLIDKINEDPSGIEQDWQEAIRNHFHLSADEERSLTNLSVDKVKHIQDYLKRAAHHIRQGGAVTGKLVERPPHERTAQFVYDIDFELVEKRPDNPKI
jgi:hypothetical protein